MQSLDLRIYFESFGGIVKIILIFIGLIPSIGQAEDRDLYYYGVAQLTDLKDGTVSQEKLLLTKYIIPSKEMIVEIACTKSKKSTSSYFSSLY